jgi:hypothetical protein
MIGNSLNGTLDDRRVSEQTWVGESDVPAAARLTKRIDYYLDLEATSSTASEFYQVGIYIYQFS